MKTLVLLLAAAAMCSASDMVGVYARIDRVVLDPNATEPDAIQIWGVFSLAKTEDRNEYLPPVRGYLYLKLTESKDATRKEWADMKSVAGGGEIVSFGTRYQLKMTVRKPGEPPSQPDAYVIAFGLSRHRYRSDYPPVKRLIDFKD